jgi:hypothetical protein
MDAFNLIPESYVRSDAFWLGRLSTAIGIAAENVKTNPAAAQKDLRATLAEFIASSVPSEELRQGLRGYLDA